MRQITRLRLAALAIGLVAGAMGIIGTLWLGSPLMPSYLMAWLFWGGIAAGMLFVLLLAGLVDGEWGAVLADALRLGARSIPLLALLFLPVLFDLSAIYPWAQGAAPGQPPPTAVATGYLKPGFFIGRSLVYLGLWLVIGMMFSRADALRPDRARRAGIGLAVLALVITFASMDWAMSLEPDWRSTIYGLATIGVEVPAGLAAATILTALVLPEDGRLSRAVLNDLAILMFGAIAVEAYLLFTQYHVIWSADLPPEIAWYLRRGHDGWFALFWIVLMTGIAAPLLLLLWPRFSGTARGLGGIAALVLATSFLAQYWTIMPAFRPDRLAVSWQDPIALLAVGGLWLAIILPGRRPYDRATVPATSARLEAGHG